MTVGLAVPCCMAEPWPLPGNPLPVVCNPTVQYWFPNETEHQQLGSHDPQCNRCLKDKVQLTQRVMVWPGVEAVDY